MRRTVGDITTAVEEALSVWMIAQPHGEPIPLPHGGSDSLIRLVKVGDDLLELVVDGLVVFQVDASDQAGPIPVKWPNGAPPLPVGAPPHLWTL
mgnify:CR=1 FL=1